MFFFTYTTACRWLHAYIRRYQYRRRIQPVTFARANGEEVPWHVSLTRIFCDHASDDTHHTHWANLFNRPTFTAQF